MVLLPYADVRHQPNVLSHGVDFHLYRSRDRVLHHSPKVGWSHSSFPPLASPYLGQSEKYRVEANKRKQSDDAQQVYRNLTSSSFCRVRPQLRVPRAAGGRLVVSVRVQGERASNKHSFENQAYDPY